MLNPWDGQHEEIRLLRDGGEHQIVGIDVFTSDGDVDDDRVGISFRTSSGKTLRVRLPPDQVAQLGTLLLDLAERRRCLRQDGPR
jgi:hypothetical protein